MANTRRLVVEVVGDAKGLGKAFSEAEKSAGQLGDGLGELDAKNSKSFANVNKVIAGAGLAIGAFAVKGVMDFQNLGIEVGKFSDATGLSAEESSRWIEVASDVGVEASTLEGIINKMNVTAGKSPQTFTDLGVEIAKTSDGATDASGTLLNVIDHLNGIKDPAKRAEEGTRLLGRGWKETAELVGKGSDQIRRDLDAVAGSKVLTDDDVGTARGLRNAFDSIGDAVDELLLSLGKNLAPAIVEIADVIVDVVDAAGPLVKIIGDSLSNALEQVAPLLEGVGSAVEFVGEVLPTANAGIKKMEEVLAANEDTLYDAGVDFIALFEAVETGTITSKEFAKVIEDAGGSMDVYDGIAFKMTGTVHGLADAELEAATAASEQADKLEESRQAAQLARDEQNRLADAAYRVEQKVRDQMAAWDEITGRLDTEQAFLNLQDTFDDLIEKMDTARLGILNQAVTTEESQRQQRQAILATEQQVVDYIAQLGNVPAEKVTRYLALIDEGKFAEVEQRLAILTRNRTMELSIIAKGGSGFSGNISLTGVRVFDQGGVANWTRGEHRLAMIAGGETVVPTHKPGVGVGGNTYQIQVAALDPRQAAEVVVEAIRVYERRNGPGWRN